MPETCGVCADEVPYSLTVHVLIHTKTDAGVVDYYVCRSCYEDHLEPLFTPTSSAADRSASDGDPSNSAADPSASDPDPSASDDDPQPE